MEIRRLRAKRDDFFEMWGKAVLMEEGGTGLELRTEVNLPKIAKELHSLENAPLKIFLTSVTRPAGSLGHQKGRLLIVYLSELRTYGQWNFGTMELWHNETSCQWNFGTMEL